MVEATPQLKCVEIFAMMDEHLKQGKGENIIKKVQAVFCWEITPKKGAKPAKVYELDLKNGNGTVIEHRPKKADATFTMTDDDFEAVCMGKMNGQTAFMTGKMKIKGNLAKATKFTPDLFPPPTPEALAEFRKAKL